MEEQAESFDLDRNNNQRKWKEMAEMLSESEDEEEVEERSLTLTSSSEGEEMEQVRSESRLEANSCDIFKLLCRGFGWTRVCCAPVPTPPLHFCQPLVSIQPTVPQACSYHRPHSPLLPHSVPQQDPEALELSAQGGLVVLPPHHMHSSLPLQQASTPLSQAGLTDLDRNNNQRKRKEMALMLSESEDEERSLIQTCSSEGEEMEQVRSESSSEANSCDIFKLLRRGFGCIGLCCPPVPTPPLHCQPLVSIQPTVPQACSYHRPHSPLLLHSVPQQDPEALEDATGNGPPLFHYLPSMSYLTPNPPFPNATSYLTRGPGGNSSGVVTDACFQSPGQILQRSSGQHAGTAEHQSYPRGNLSSQPAVHEHDLWPPAYPGSLGPDEDHQPPSSFIVPGDGHL